MTRLCVVLVGALLLLATPGCAQDSGGGTAESSSARPDAATGDVDLTETASIASSISAIVAASPEDNEGCPLATGAELTAAIGVAGMTVQRAEATVSRRQGLGDTVFCVFDATPRNANLLVFTDTSAGIDGVSRALRRDDLSSGENFEGVGAFRGGTGYLSSDVYREVESFYGLWIADDGSWGLSQSALTLDRAALERTVELVIAALSE